MQRASRALSLAGAFLLAASLSAAAPAAADADIDALLELQAAQAESLEALDAIVETTVEAAGVTRRTRSRLRLDKAAGSARMQSLDEQGRVAMDMKVEGAEVSYLLPDGSWKRLVMDAQTKATLEEMGVEFPKATGGQGRSEGKRQVGTKRERVRAQVERKKRGHRLERRSDLDRAVPPSVNAAVDLGRPLGLEQEGLLDRGPSPRSRQGRSRAVLRHLQDKPGAVQANRPYDAVLEHIDEDTGVVVESSHFVRAENLTGMVDLEGRGGEMDIPSVGAAKRVQPQALRQAQRKAGNQKRPLPSWARRMKDPEGRELVEIRRTSILKARRLGGAVVPQETEQVELTGVGEVRQRVKWEYREAGEKP
jgi:hypothetical protein